MIPGFTTHESSHGKKQKRTLNTPVSPWEISDNYSGLEMTAIVVKKKKKKNFSGDKISQDSSEEPTQLARGCTPKQTGDRSSDP